MTAGDYGTWCFRCRHMIAYSAPDRRWLHFSDDDWSGQTCGCVNELTQCRPGPDGSDLDRWRGYLREGVVPRRRLRPPGYVPVLKRPA